MSKMVGVSLVQPVPWAILAAGRRVVNVPAGSVPPRYRGEVLLHASAACDLDAFDEANRWMLRRGVLPSGVHLPWSDDLPRGGFVGRANVVQVLHPGDIACCERNLWLDPELTGGVIILDDVTPLPAFVAAPAPSMAGLTFEIDSAIFARALAQASRAKTEAEQRAVVAVWGGTSRRRAVGRRTATPGVAVVGARPQQGVIA